MILKCVGGGEAANPLFKEYMFSFNSITLHLNKKKIKKYYFLKNCLETKYMQYCPCLFLL